MRNSVPPPTNRESPLRTFSQNLMTGMALGTGSSIAHHGINGMMGSSTMNSQPPNLQPQVMPPGYKYPSREELDLKKCILENNGDTWACQEYYEKFASQILHNS